MTFGLGNRCSILLSYGTARATISMMRRFAQPVCFAIAVCLRAPVLAQDACPGDMAGRGIVARAAADGDIALADGRVMRLTQLEPGADASWRSAFAALSPGTPLRLRVLSEAPDRWGRVQARVAADYGAAGEAPWLERELVRRGDARVRPETVGGDCAGALLAAENEARRARAGLWAAEGALLSAERPAEILRWAGGFVVVEGRILSVGARRTRTYLNFGKDWKSDLTVTLSKRMLEIVAFKGLTAPALRGRLVRVRGIVENRDGPAMEIARPDEIELVEEGVSR